MVTGTKEIFRKYHSAEVFEKIKDFSTVAEMWENSVKEYPDCVAIDYNGTKHTYAELDADVASFRTVLANAGLALGDRVCLVSQNSYGFVKAYLAAVTLGITVAIIPAQLDEMTVFGCSMKFGAKAVVYAPELESKASVAKAKNITTISTAETAEEKTAASDKITEETPCIIMFTGGTTGKSKGALLSHGAVMQGTVNGCYGYNDVFCQRYLLVLPLSHVFGLIRNLMTSLYTGSALFICMNNKDMFRDIAMFKPTIFVVVPAIAEMALNLSRQFGRNMLGEDMKYIICGAAPVAPYLVKEYSKLGIGLCPGYGLTESANLVSGNPDFLNRPDSVGLMYPNQEYKIVDGELWLKGRNMMSGYVSDAEENANAYEDGWFKTGDLVRVDDEGFLYIAGRIKEIILLSNGENISPAEVEAKFNELETVQDSQVFEDVDENGTHILALEVVPRMAELKKIDTPDPMKYLYSQLVGVNNALPAVWKVSKIVIRDSDFARSPAMKILRYKKCN